MAIDASIALGQAPQAPLQFAQGLVGLKGQQLQQNALTQQIGANQATSQAMQQAYDPVTGQLDYNKLTALMSQDPRAAYNLLPTQNAILENQQKAQGLNTSRFDLAQKQNTFWTGQLGGLANKPDLSMQDLVGAAALAVRQNLAQPDEIVRELQNAPTEPAQLRQFVQQKLQQSMINAGQFQGALPQNSQVNTGNQISFVSTDPITGRPTVQGNIQNQMSPGEANSPVAGVGPDGTPFNITKQQFANQANGMQPSQVQPVSTFGLPGTGSNGRYPSAPQGQQGPPSVPGVQTGLSPVDQAAAGVLGQGAAQGIQALQQQATAAQQAVYQFQNMRSALADINTGPGTDWRNNAAAFATGLAPGISQAIGIDPQKIASQEEFHKYATQATQATLAGLGNGTDSMLASAVAANPGTQLSKLGNQQILDVLQAGQQGLIAKNQAWQSANLPPSQFNKWSTQWTKDIDPRVFVVQNMDQPAAAKMFNSLKPAEQVQFKQSLRTAIQRGIVPNPAAQQQSQ